MKPKVSPELSHMSDKEREREREREREGEEGGRREREGGE